MFINTFCQSVVQEQRVALVIVQMNRQKQLFVVFDVEKDQLELLFVELNESFEMRVMFLLVVI